MYPKHWFAVVCCACCLAGSAATPEEVLRQATDPSRAVQTVYRDGVPHTDRHGRRMMEYDPERSFFPIGLWGVHLPESSPAGWDEIAGAGFNTVWGAWRVYANPETLEIADRYGLQMIFMHAIAPEQLREIKDHPRLFASIWFDEPIGHLEKPGVIDDLYAQFLDYKRESNAIAPDLAVFVNDAAWIVPPATDWYAKFNTAGDVACHDNYMVTISSSCTPSLSKASGGIPESNLFTTLLNDESKPSWFIAGAFEGGVQLEGFQPFPFRFPSPLQLRASIYAALIHGATGIHYFILDGPMSRGGMVTGISPHPLQSYPGTPLPEATPAQQAQALAGWDMAKSINAELEQLTPALLSPTAAAGELDFQVEFRPAAGTAVSPNPVRALLKREPGTGAYILLTVNLDAAALDGVFAFDREVASVELLFTGSNNAVNPSADRRGFTRHYEPFDVHVYRIVPEPAQ